MIKTWLLVLSGLHLPLCQTSKVIDISTPLYRQDFPILDREAYPNTPLVYLDTAASSHKPLVVLEAMQRYYLTSHSNVHRGAHALAKLATDQFENARDIIKQFIQARRREEIIFTKGATEAINIVALSWTQRLQPGDEIVLSVMEHHSNLVPWQLAAQRTGAVLKFVRLNGSMEFDLEHYYSLLSPKTKLVAVVHASNVLGTCNPIKEIARAAHAVGAKVLVDACQSAPHMEINVQDLDVDFMAVSGHKMCGPTGVGFLYGTYDELVTMPPVFGGGEMIQKVELQSSTYALPPSRFEAGTPPIAAVVGLAEACKYLQQIGLSTIFEYEHALGNHLYNRLAELDGLTLFGPPASSGRRTGLVAFSCAGRDSKDLAAALDKWGFAVRAGHFCTQPLHLVLGVPYSLRASVYFYNNKREVDAFIRALREEIQTKDS